MKELKEKRGITLIALVITIIVLLILAGVTIVTLTGDNGLLQKVTTAKQANEEASVLEMIKTEVAGSYNLEGKIDLSELKRNLKHLNISDEDIIPTIKGEQETFPVIVKLDNYAYDILEDGTVDKHVDFATLESLYGKVVNNYTGYEATDVTEWKLLYVDEESKDAIIISSNKLSARAIPKVSDNGFQYTGSVDVRKYEYAVRYNELWLDECKTSESTYNNAKATAYLCDPENWKQYKTGKAKYAAGSPTLEILLASSKNRQLKEIRNSIDEDIKNVNSKGYPVVIKADLDINFYNTGDYYTGNYWLASPSEGYDDYLCTVYRGSQNYRDHWRNDMGYGLRPVVCLPASAIEVVGEGDNAVLNYK